MNKTTRMQILVKPSKKTFRLYKDEEGRLIAELTSPPTKGKANKELLQKLAKKLECRVNLVRGHASTTKVVEVSLSQDELEEKLNRVFGG